MIWLKRTDVRQVWKCLTVRSRILIKYDFLHGGINMSNRRKVNIEGYSPEQILEMTDEMLNNFVFIDEPIIFIVGTSEILGSFKIENEKLIIELAQIDGGGEGVLLTLWVLAEKYAKKRNLLYVEWIVHAINCAKPNLKLREVLNKRGFKVEHVDGIGDAYHLVHKTS